ncbi:MAG: hypothetical protein K8I60_22815 [Anaerolineae bacterium]|nr:hypothetical protein [Anaerolineae bacterium]
MMKKLLILCLLALLFTGTGGAAAQDNGPVSIIFMHHSTGLGVIQQGNVREGFTQLGYDFWDHGYNDEGLVNPAGDYLGVNWDVPGDNTDPDGWDAIFQQPFTDPPSNTFSHMLQHDVIIFKSCFPTSDIYDEDMFAAYQRYYLGIRDVIDQHPDKIFIAWTTPPLVPDATTPENAARARRWAAYLTSDDYLAGHPNVFVFDFFNLLADEQGFLKTDYRQDESDSHPNEVANRMAGPILVDFVDQAIHNFVPGQPSVQPVIVPPENVETLQPVLIVPGDMIENFDGDPAQLSDRWWTYGDEGVVFEAFDLAAPGYDSEQALKVTFTSLMQRYGGFGMGFDPAQDWSASGGISFYWQADQPDMTMSVYVTVSDAANLDAPTTAFQVYRTPPVGDWEQVTLAWDEFAKAEWMGEEGLDVFDPTHIVDISFGFGDWEKALAATVWVDEVRLMSAE